MSQESELIRLENFVSKLLEKFNQLKDENARLNQELTQRDDTIAGLNDQIENRELEKIEIGDRVNSIIGKIEDWESTFGGETGVDEVPPNDPSRQGSLFSVDSSEENEGEAME